MQSPADTEEQTQPLLDKDEGRISPSSTSAVGSEPEIEITPCFKRCLIVFIAAAIISEVGYAFFMGEVDKSTIGAVTHLEHAGVNIVTATLGAFAATAALIPVLSLERAAGDLAHIYQSFKNSETDSKVKIAYFLMFTVCQLSFLFEGFGATIGYLKKGWGRSAEWVIIVFSVLAQLLLANMTGGGKHSIEAVESLRQKWLGCGKLFNRQTVLQWGLLIFGASCHAIMSGFNVSEIAEFIPTFQAVGWKWTAGALAFFRMAVCTSYPALKRAVTEDDHAIRPLALKKAKKPSEILGLIIASINFLAQVMGDYTFARVFTQILNCDEYLTYLSWTSVAIGLFHHWQKAVLNATDNAEGLAYLDDHVIQPYCCCRA